MHRKLNADLPGLLCLLLLLLLLLSNGQKGRSLAPKAQELDHLPGDAQILLLPILLHLLLQPPVHVVPVSVVRGDGGQVRLHL